jgi:hypothetical protein
MIRQLTADLAAANERAKAAEAEVAGWRRAVRWHAIKDGRWELRLCGIGPYSFELAVVWQYGDGWIMNVPGFYKQGRQPDLTAACAKVCELLGIPVVLPVGGE